MDPSPSCGQTLGGGVCLVILGKEHNGKFQECHSSGFGLFGGQSEQLAAILTNHSKTGIAPGVLSFWGFCWKLAVNLPHED